MSIADGFEKYKIFNDDLNDDQKLKVKTLYKAMESTFAKIDENYTPHGFNHVMTVVKNIDILLDKMDKRGRIKLNEEQAFLLLLGTIIHDAGMAQEIFDDDPKRPLTPKQNEKLRKKHHLRS